MKNLSNYDAARIFIGIFFVIWILVLCFIVANHSLSCVDKHGCLKSYCDISWLSSQYKALVKANQKNC